MNAQINEKTDAPQETAAAPSARKPRLALFVATACGLGYIPVAPGTWGSLAGLALSIVPLWILLAIIMGPRNLWHLLVGEAFWSWRWDATGPSSHIDPMVIFQCAIALIVAVLGVWSASRAANFWQAKDPQRVVIDEVSGQHLALLIGCGVPIWWRLASAVQVPMPALMFMRTDVTLNWKYLLLGLILFRLFDIWKPFPVRQAESLPGGWGIMADDWVAAIYAGVGLWIARAAGL